jgi:hypothetical protein
MLSSASIEEELNYELNDIILAASYYDGFY